MNDFSGNLKLALPNKGSLSEGAVSILKRAGYRCQRSGREMVIQDRENGIDFVFLRPRDIALYVGKGIIDLGITGIDLVLDSGAEVQQLMPLGFGKSRFCFACPKTTHCTDVMQLNGKRMATSYPHLLELELAKRKMSCPIVKLDGAVEISVALGVADAIADVVDSGATLREAGLEIIGEPMLFSQALLIGGMQLNKTYLSAAQLLMGRIQGVLRAEEYMVIEYDIPRQELPRACELTPGIESPTIAPLSNSDWVAVKAMIKRKDSNMLMDKLYALGAKGIILMEISSCRI